MPPDLSIDTREELEAEAALLYQARQILEARFRTGKHDTTADAVRRAAAELISRSRHPSRQGTPFAGDVDLDTREPEIVREYPEAHPDA